jgi:hypothetical protein
LILAKIKTKEKSKQRNTKTINKKGNKPKNREFFLKKKPYKRTKLIFMQ